MPQSEYIFNEAVLFRAEDESVVRDGAVWVRDGRIVFAGPAQALGEQASNIPTHSQGGRFIMPGMTETHAHLSFADASPFAIGETPVEEATLTAVRNSALMVKAGFTSAISFGSTYKIDVALRSAINDGRILGPRGLLNDAMNDGELAAKNAEKNNAKMREKLLT